jgi:hypothetical protein
VNPTDTILQVKKLISQDTDQYRLFFAGKELQDHEILSSYNIQNLNEVIAHKRAVASGLVSRPKGMFILVKTLTGAFPFSSGS